MTERKKNRFWLGFAIYLLLLALLLGAALYVFRDFLICFEATRPERAVEAFGVRLERGEADRSAVRAGLKGLDLTLQSEDDAIAAALQKLRGARLAEDLSQSGEETRVCRVIADGVNCGSVTLRRQEAGRYGFAAWELGEERYDFSPWYYTLAVTVPTDYTVRCGGVTLDDSYVAERGIPYAALSECYETLEGMPTMQRYETGALLSEYTLQVFDASGRELSPEEQNEERYLDNCDAQTRERMAAYAERYVTSYVRFTSIKSDYGVLMSMLVPHSDAARRMEQAVGENWWSRSAYCELLGVEVNRCVDLGEGHLLLDLSYETETKIFSEPEVKRYNLRMLLVEQNGDLLAEHSFNY